MYSRNIRDYFSKTTERQNVHVIFNVFNVIVGRGLNHTLLPLASSGNLRICGVRVF